MPSLAELRTHQKTLLFQLFLVRAEMGSHVSRELAKMIAMQIAAMEQGDVAWVEKSFKELHDENFDKHK